jgi:hypothetical protein
MVTGLTVKRGAYLPSQGVAPFQILKYTRRRQVRLSVTTHGNRPRWV